ncbi:MAG: hypothetical protein ACI4W2_10935 [Eubacterium sp.]
MTRKHQILLILVGFFILIFSLILQLQERKILILWLLPPLYALAVSVIESVKGKADSRWNPVSDVLFLLIFVSWIPFIWLYDGKPAELQAFYSHRYITWTAILFMAAVIVKAAARRSSRKRR